MMQAACYDGPSLQLLQPRPALCIAMWSLHRVQVRACQHSVCCAFQTWQSFLTVSSCAGTAPWPCRGAFVAPCCFWRQPSSPFATLMPPTCPVLDGLHLLTALITVRRSLSLSSMQLNVQGRAPLERTVVQRLNGVHMTVCGMLPRRPVQADRHGVAFVHSACANALQQRPMYAEHLPADALDGSSDTYWHTQWGRVEPPYPHVLTVVMGGDTNTVNGLRYTARSDGETNGRIGDYEVCCSDVSMLPAGSKCNKHEHCQLAISSCRSGGRPTYSNDMVVAHYMRFCLQILLSEDGEAFGTPVATGTFEDIAAQQTVTFDAAPAKAVRLRMLTPAKASQPWASIGDLQIVAPDSTPTPPPPTPTPPPSGPPLPSGAANLPRAGWTAAADSSQSGELAALRCMHHTQVSLQRIWMP